MQELGRVTIVKGYDSTHVAHVAEALERLNPEFGYDNAADNADELLRRFASVRLSVREYAADELSDEAFDQSVSVALSNL